MKNSKINLLFFLFREDKSQIAFAAVVTIFVSSHKDTGTTVFTWAFTAQAMDFTVLVNLNGGRKITYV